MKSVIDPKPARRGLFSVARDASSEVTDEEYQHGWQLFSACPSGGTWCCSDSDSDNEKEAPAAPSTPRFGSFDVYQVVGCLSGTSRLGNGLHHEVARRQLESNMEGWVSASLEAGVCDNPSLQGLTDLTETVGGPVCLANAIALLLQSRSRSFMFDRPTIHLPSWAAPMWGAAVNGMEIDYVADVAFGPGYGVLPSTIPDAPNTGWIYVTGPVEYALGPKSAPWLATDSLTERRLNLSEAREEQRAIYRFDPCGGFKVQFCLPTCECPAAPPIAQRGLLTLTAIPGVVTGGAASQAAQIAHLDLIGVGPSSLNAQVGALTLAGHPGTPS